MGKDAELGFLAFKRQATLRQFEILASLKETGSITETARLLKTSPANISSICVRFESHFNFLIFEKKRKGLILTDKGNLLMEHIIKISNAVKPHYEDLSIFFE
jgi:DNA-binding transcriptional LysR family regulator